MERSELVPLEKIQRMAADVRPDDVCNMQYTSGTTGFPKGVMLTHRNVVNDGKCIGDRMDLSTADRLMIHVPMFHCFGMVLSMTASMTHGATLCPMPYFCAAASLALHHTGEDHLPSTAFPRCSSPCCNHEDFDKTDFSHMRTGIMAGAGCPARAHAARRPARRDEHDRASCRSTVRPKSAPGSTMSSLHRPARPAHGDRRSARSRTSSARLSTRRPARSCPTARTANSARAATTS